MGTTKKIGSIDARTRRDSVMTNAPMPPDQEILRVKLPKVCMLATALPPAFSGAGLQALRLSTELHHRGAPLWILTTRFHGEHRIKEMDGIPVVQVPVPGQRHSLNRGAWATLLLGIYWSLIRHNRDWDLVHIHGGYSHLLGGVLAARTLRKGSLLKISMIGGDDLEGIESRRLSWLWQKIFRSASLFVAMNNTISKSLIKGGIKEERIVPIPNGVDTNVFQPIGSEDSQRILRQKLGLPDGVLITFTGCIERRKGIHKAVAAFSRIASQNSNVHLLLIGPSGTEQEYTAFVQEEISRSGMSARIIMPGSVSNLPEYLAASDIFLLPSSREGMSNSLLEAMSTGLACVITGADGMEDIVSTGKQGIVVPMAASEEELAVKLEEVIQNPDLRSRLGTAARAHVLQSLPLQMVADRYLDIYTTWFARHQKRGGQVS